MEIQRLGYKEIKRFDSKWKYYDLIRYSNGNEMFRKQLSM